MPTSHIPVLILIGRPAAGKSEILKYLHDLSDKQRLKKCHIGPFREIDDFPMLWAWFEEDAILTGMGRKRLHTDTEGYFVHNDLWHLLIRRLDLEFRKLLADDPHVLENSTVIIEFSRGSEHGGYGQAFSHFSTELLCRASVLYLDVSFEESLRKNRRRFNPDRPHSILEHGLPDDKLRRLYRETDWQELTAADSEWIRVSGCSVPYVVFSNEDDVTTDPGPELAHRLEKCLERLYRLRSGASTQPAG
jgi:hypothetical protein